VQLAGRAAIRNSRGGVATLSGSIMAGPHRLRLMADHGSTLRVTGGIESTSLVMVNCERITDAGLRHLHRIADQLVLLNLTGIDQGSLKYSKFTIN
jgi:hypothetical protein